MSIEERARRVYKPAKSAFFGDEAPRTSPSPTNKAQNEELNQTEKKTLKSLEIFDKFDAPEKSTSEAKGDKYNRSVSFYNEQTPAWRTANDLFQEEGGETENNNNNSNSINPEDEFMNNLYRVRLDNIEFDEDELFDNFRPIFDFNNPEPDYAIDYPTVNKSGKTNTNNPELYGYSSSSPTNMANNSNYFKLKSNLQMDQTSDLLLP